VEPALAKPRLTLNAHTVRTVGEEGRRKVPVVTGSSTASPAGMTSHPGRRARVAARTRLDFWFDAVILVGYTVAYSYGFTGVVIHEWLGIGLGIALLLHLTLHWDWVVRTTRRLVSPRGHDKLIWLVNLALLFAMTLCVASGIAISRVALPEMGIYTLQSPFWFRLHALTAEVTVGLVPLHVALRWRWIAGVGRRLLARRPGRRSR
jgi:Domain of unknown function (DUF4405)